MGLKTDIFIQARMSSTRLPGKVLSDIGGLPVLIRTYNRIRKTKNVDDVVVITTKNFADDRIVDLCKRYKIPVMRGSENDCLHRHYEAAKEFKSDLVFKIPSDCPFSDPFLNSKVISIIQNNYENIDYVSNYHPPTFPDGLDIEGARFDILERANFEAKKKHEREHTFPYIWDNPTTFSIANYINAFGNMFMTHRWTLDFPKDLIFIKKIYSAFDFSEDFYYEDILNFLRDNPKVSEINSIYAGVNWYRNETKNLKTITRHQYKKI